MAPSSSRDPDSDPSAHLGQRHLKRVRLAAGFVKQATLATRLNVSVDYISKAETGAMPPVRETLLAWLDACNVTGQERDFIYGLWIIARATHSGVPQFFEKYLKREAQAEYLLLWCPVVPSGLFQVPEYARELFLAAGMDEDQAAENVDARLARQAVLDGPDAPHVTVLLRAGESI
jgi:transcriptional regulator with XRE-family HTH domain